MHLHDNGIGDSEQDSLLDWATYYSHEFDLSIVRVIEGRKQTYKGEKWKRWQTERANEEQLVQWFTDGQSSGIGVITGEVSAGGLVCRDFDESSAYDAWRDRHPRLALDLPTVQTSRGYHVYARADLSEYEGPCYHKFGDGELRIRNVLCVLPPSKHKSGASYRWMVPLGDGIPEVDMCEVGWLSKGLHRQHRTTQTTQGTQDIMSCVPMNNGNHSADASQSEIGRAIEASIPQKHGQRHDSIFILARWLKRLMPGASLAELRPIVRRWHERALPMLGTKAWEDSWGDFAETWGNVRHPMGSGPIEQVVARAEASPVPPICGQMGYSCDNTIRLVKLCRELHQEHNGGQFPLSCRKAAELLGGASHKVYAERLRVLCIDGVLKCVVKGTAGGRLASEYKYLGD